MPRERSYAFNAALTELKWARAEAVDRPEKLALMIDTAVSRLFDYPYSVVKSDTYAAEWWKYGTIVRVHEGSCNIMYVDTHVETHVASYEWVAAWPLWYPTPTQSPWYIDAP